MKSLHRTRELNIVVVDIGEKVKFHPHIFQIIVPHFLYCKTFFFS